MRGCFCSCAYLLCNVNAGGVDRMCWVSDQSASRLNANLNVPSSSRRSQFGVNAISNACFSIIALITAAAVIASVAASKLSALNSISTVLCN